MKSIKKVTLLMLLAAGILAKVCAAPGSGNNSVEKDSAPGGAEEVKIDTIGTTAKPTIDLATTQLSVYGQNVGKKVVESDVIFHVLQYSSRSLEDFYRFKRLNRQMSKYSGLEDSKLRKYLNWLNKDEKEKQIVFKTSLYKIPLEVLYPCMDYISQNPTTSMTISGSSLGAYDIIQKSKSFRDSFVGSKIVFAIDERGVNRLKELYDDTVNMSVERFGIFLMLLMNNAPMMPMVNVRDFYLLHLKAERERGELV